MANKYWVSTGSQSYTTSTNWSNTPGGAGGGGVPGSGDNLFFNSAWSSGNCAMSGTLNLNSIYGAGTASLTCDGIVNITSGIILDNGVNANFISSTFKFIGPNYGVVKVNDFGDVIMSGALKHFISQNGLNGSRVNGNLIYSVTDTSFPAINNFPEIDFNSVAGGTVNPGLSVVGNLLTKRGVGPLNLTFYRNHSGSFYDASASYDTSKLTFTTDTSGNFAFSFTSGTIVANSFYFAGAIGTSYTGIFNFGDVNFIASGTPNSYINNGKNQIGITDIASGHIVCNFSTANFSAYGNPNIHVQILNGADVSNFIASSYATLDHGEIIATSKISGVNTYGPNLIAGTYGVINNYSGGLAFCDAGGGNFGAITADTITFSSGAYIAQPDDLTEFGDRYDADFTEYGGAIATPIIVNGNFTIFGAPGYTGSLRTSNYNSAGIIVGGNLNWNGLSSSQKMNLAFSSPWNLTVSGTATVRNAAVRYSYFTGSGTVNATGCLDLCGNTNWSFGTSAANYISRYAVKTKSCQPLGQHGIIAYGGNQSVNFNTIVSSSPNSDSINDNYNIWTRRTDGYNFSTGRALNPSSALDSIESPSGAFKPSRTIPGKLAFQAGTRSVIRQNNEPKT